MKGSGGSARSKVLWSLLFFAIAGLSVYAIVSQSGTFTLDTFLDYIGKTRVFWLLCAVLSMVLYIVLEGEAVRAAVRAFGCAATHGNALIYSASDIYFSAITPSATGGQPASAYFMVKDGVPPLIATVALIVNLTMYTASILVLGLLMLLTCPHVLSSFGHLSRVMIAVGFLVQVLLASFFVLLLVNEKLLHRICSGAIHLVCRLRILRHEERRQASLSRHMEEYVRSAKMIMEHKKALAKVFFFNLGQRFFVLCVPFFVSLASGAGLGRAVSAWAVQCCAVLGSNFVPIPGGMGVSDYLMLDGFERFIPAADVVDFQLLTRSISFYFCVVFCGILTLIKFILLKKRDKS